MTAGGSGTAAAAAPLKRPGSVASRGGGSPSSGRTSVDCKPSTEPVRRAASSPTTTSTLVDGYQHYHHHQLGGGNGSGGGGYLSWHHHPHRGQPSPPSPPPPPRVVLAPVSSPSAAGRFWKHSAGLGELATEFGGCFAAQRAAAAAAAAAGYASYRVGTGGGGVAGGVEYATSPHAAPYYTSQVS